MSRFIAAALAVSLLVASPLPAVAAPATMEGNWRPRDVAYPGIVRVEVDATDVERGIFRVKQHVPVKGKRRITLLFPKWVPGNHAATVRIERLVGLVIRSAGRRLVWTRDPVDMHAFHVELQKDVKAIDVEFQFLSATDSDEGRVVMTPEMMNLQWFSLLLYPAGYFARQITFEAEVTLPEGWELTTQLETAARSGSTVRFKPVSLETLIDSPLFAGRHFRRFELGGIHGAPVFLDVVADAPEYLAAPDAAIDAYRRLVVEAAGVFGRPPFRRYNFMLGLTREMGSIGTEHLASSENTRPLDYFSDWQSSALLAHEFSHSWNGKARRPADLWSSDFNLPMRNSMLWLYEGQTQFWAYVLSARSGLLTQGQVMDTFARLAATQSSQPGREWRPLADTVNDWIIARELFEEPWPSWHREGFDSYGEANLMWLQADGLIRELSNGRRSLADFARTFFAGGGERASLYDFDDVVGALQKVQPYDWASFIGKRLHSVAPEAPSDWLRDSGYRLVFRETPTAEFAARQKRNDTLGLRYSIGLVLRASSGEVTEVIWNSPAFDAAVVPRALILLVNGSKYDPDLLLSAIQKNRSGDQPIRLTVKSRGRERTLSLDYRGGLRFPRLERVSGTPDHLGQLLAPQQPRPSNEASAAARPNSR
jgi:predicted metalloprotease with PDZ domain